jgi:PIN domain nuclease of toxin-antitoxin system
MSKPPAYLLDTHVFLWLMQGSTELKQREHLEQAAQWGGLYLSPISCWEIGMLASRSRIHLPMPCADWLTHALKAPGLSVQPLTPEAAVEASYLPDAFHGDPADRMLVATARTQRLILATRDEKILAYSQQGYVQTLPC